MQTMTFGAACFAFFGKKEGQTLGEFNQEIKALSDQDRADLIAMFPSVGITIEAHKLAA